MEVPSRAESPSSRVVQLGTIEINREVLQAAGNQDFPIIEQGRCVNAPGLTHASGGHELALLREGDPVWHTEKEREQC